jgi:hypothetical protein
MSKIKTFKGQLPIGFQEKIHLSTADGLTGYKINKFQILSKTPGDGDVGLIAQIFLTDQTGNITSTVDFNNSDFLGVAYYKEQQNSTSPSVTEIIFDKETFNQDIFISVTDEIGSTTPCNYYLELEQFKIDLQTSTFHTLKNIRSSKQ